MCVQILWLPRKWGLLQLQCQQERERGNGSCDNLHPTNCSNGHLLDSVLEMTLKPCQRLPTWAQHRERTHLLIMIPCMIVLFLTMWFMSYLWNYTSTRRETEHYKGLIGNTNEEVLKWCISTIESLGSSWHIKRCYSHFYWSSLLWLKWEKTWERSHRDDIDLWHVCKCRRKKKSLFLGWFELGHKE